MIYASSPTLTTPDPAPEARSRNGWQRAFSDLPRQHGFTALEVEGKLPADLRGTLYRNGPGLMGLFGERYAHWLDGDGAASAVRFDGGRAEGAARIVATPALEEEREAGRALYGGYEQSASWRLFLRSPQKRIKNPANTNVLPWNGKLLALWEGGLPTELDPDTLETRGPTTLDGSIPETFSAHPHAVAGTGTVFNFGVRMFPRPQLDVFALDDRGCRLLTEVPLPAATMVHDFIATERHLVFFVSPLRLRLLRVLVNIGGFADNLSWRPSLGTEVIVIPLNAPEKPWRYTTEPFYQWHFANAFDQGDEVVVDFVRYEDFTSNDWLRSIWQSSPIPQHGGKLVRATLSPRKGGARFETVADVPCEFPRVAPRVEGRRHRYVWAANHTSRRHFESGPQTEIVRMDCDTGTVSRFDFGPGRYPSEPIFVPRPGATGEDDGWALAMVYDSALHRSFCAVVPGEDPSRGPIAKAWFDHHLPPTFHGAWAG